MNYLQEYQKLLGVEADGSMGPNTAKAMMKDLGIEDKLLFCHVLGQMWHESGNFQYGRENLNYSAVALRKAWPSRFNASNATEYERQPEKIANKVYADRMGNGNEASGDGWKYRGIFGLQLTGKTNIQAFLKSLGLPIDTNPDELLKDPRNYFKAGFFWFKDNKVDKICVGTSNSVIDTVSNRVNGGTLGLIDRRETTKKMFQIVGV